MRTPITYYGGKQNLSERIVSMMPRHKIYCEPFFGGGAVFFAKPKAGIEVINDKNGLLINFFKVCQSASKFKELRERIRLSLHSESDYIRARNIYRGRSEVSDVDKAWAVWIMANECHSGSLYGGWKFCNGTAGTHFGKVFRNKREEFNDKLYDRLSEVQISCRDALKVIKNRDSVDTLFYLDPPYPGAVQGHYYGYGENDLADLLDLLSRINGKFILSNYWTDTLRSFVNENKWNHKEVKVTTHTSVHSRIRESTEVLVYNYEIEKTLF